MLDRLAVPREPRRPVREAALALLLADRQAEIRPRREAVDTLSALRREERDDVIALGDGGDTLADALDDAGALVTEYGRRVAGRVCARRRVEIGVADPARDQPHEHLAGLRLSQVELLHLERGAEPLEHRRPDLHLRDSNYTRAVRICLVTPFAWSQPHDVNEHVAGIAKALRAARPLGHRPGPLRAHGGPDRRASCARAWRGRRRDCDRRAVPISRRSSLGVPVGVRANLNLALQQGAFDVVHGFEPGLPSISYLALRDSEALGVASFFSPERLGYPPRRALREKLLGRLDALSPRHRRRRRRRRSASRATTASSRPASTPTSSRRATSAS